MRLGPLASASLALAQAAAATPAFAQEGASALAETRQVVLTADELVVERDGDRVRASGSVTLSTGERRLSADRIVYDRASDRATASGDVLLVSGEGVVLFADEFTLSGDLEEGAVEGIGVLLADGSKLVGESAIRSQGGVTVMRGASYGACRPCEEGEAPVWRIRAETVTHDETERVVRYENATFELFGAPVAWTPWFEHPDPTVERRSGFLGPTIGTDSILGVTLETPYYIDLAPNRDLTFTQILTSEEGPVEVIEYRELQPVGRTTLGGSATYGTAFDIGGGRELRGHVEGRGRYRDPDAPIADTISAGFDLALASDDTYLERYNLGSEDVLTNRAFVDRIWDRNWIVADGYFFQGLRASDVQDEIPIVLPRIEAHLETEPRWLGFRGFADASALALTRFDGLDTRRLSSTVGAKTTQISPLGDVWSLDLRLRGDLYQTSGDPRTRSEDGGSRLTGRVLPRLSARWSYPLERRQGAWRQVLEPLAGFDWTVTGADDADIPNEDSQDLEFDETNLFEASRFTGLDRVEGGAKVAWGLRFGGYSDEGFRLSGLIGQSWRFDDDRVFEAGTGLDGQLSDIVGRLEVTPGPNLDLRYRFRLDDEQVELTRSALGVLIGPPDFRLSADYVFASEGDGETAVEREEITLGGRVRLLDNLAIAAETRRDLVADNTVTGRLGLVYSNPSLSITAGVERDFTADRDAGRSTTYSIRVRFTNLTDFETQGSLDDG